MKKFLALALALAMTLSLAACGKKEDPAASGSGSGGTSSAVTPPATDENAWHTSDTAVPEGRIEVKYWCPHGSGTSAWVDGIINEFNTMQDKYFVVREYNGGYYDQIAKLQATDKSELPAFCNSSSETVGSYLHSGLIRMAQDFVDADTGYTAPAMYENLIATYGKDGKLIGYPEALSLSGFFYNKAVFEAAGIDPYSLTSMDAVYDTVCKICEGGHATYGIGEEHSGIWANYAFAREGFYTTDNDNGATGLPTKCLYDDNSNGFADVVTDYYTKWANLADKNYLYPVGSKIKDEMIPALAAGELAMIVTTNSYMAPMMDAFSADPDGYGFVPMFSVTENGKRTGFCSSGQGFFIVDNGNEEAQQGAWEYIKYFTSPEVQARWDIKNGYLPLYDEIYNNADYQVFLKDYPWIDDIITAMKSSDLSAFYAFTATNNEYTTAGATCLEAVCSGTPVDQAIAEMCETINNAFEMYNATNS